MLYQELDKLGIEQPVFNPVPGALCIQYRHRRYLFGYIVPAEELKKLIKKNGLD